MPLCIVTGSLKDSSGDAVTNAKLRVRVPVPTFNAASELIVPLEQEVTPDTSGNFTLTLQTSFTFICDVFYPPNADDSQRIITYALNIPATTTASFQSVIMSE